MNWKYLTVMDGDETVQRWVNLEHLRSLRLEGGGTVAEWDNGDEVTFAEDPAAIGVAPKVIRGPIIGTLDGSPRATKAV